MTALTLNLNAIDLTDDQYFQLCRDNRDLIERTAVGELIMPLTQGETSRCNAKLTQQLLNWAEADGVGIAFDSSGGFQANGNLPPNRSVEVLESPVAQPKRGSVNLLSISP